MFPNIQPATPPVQLQAIAPHPITVTCKKRPTPTRCNLFSGSCREWSSLLWASYRLSNLRIFYFASRRSKRSPLPADPPAALSSCPAAGSDPPQELHPSMSTLQLIQLSKMICRAQFLLFDLWVAAFPHCAHTPFFCKANSRFSSLKG